MYRWKKMLSLVLVGIMITSLLVGCGGKEGSVNKDGKKEIIIKAWQAGMGIQWLEDLILGFEKKYPEYKVTYTSTADTQGVLSALGSAEVDTTDLYFAITFNSKQLHPLKDLLDSKAEGETKTIREKFDSSYLEGTKYLEDDETYALTYGGGVIGIAYNKELFKEAGIKKLPRTTDELVNVCDTLMRKDIVPWVHFKNGGYWASMSDAFYLQYEGMDYYNNVFYANTDEQGNSPSKDVFTRKDGRYEVLKMQEKILTPDYVLSGSNSGDHISMQTQFVHGKAAMMVNGSWMANEMQSVGNVDKFGIMKTPVISSIVKKLTTVKKDSELRAVVDAIDAVADGKKPIDEYRIGDLYKVGDLEVSVADWDYIANARNTLATNFNGMGAFIPKYSDQIEGAEEFLRYLYSDEGLQIYLKATNVKLPIELDSGDVDTKDWNGFAQEVSEIMKTTTQFSQGTYNMKIHPIFLDGGAADLFCGRLYVQYFTALNEADRSNAEQEWEKLMQHIDKNYEKTWLANLE